MLGLDAKYLDLDLYEDHWQEIDPFASSSSNYGLIRMFYVKPGLEFSAYAPQHSRRQRLGES